LFVGALLSSCVRPSEFLTKSFNFQLSLVCKCFKGGFASRFLAEARLALGQIGRHLVEVINTLAEPCYFDLSFAGLSRRDVSAATQNQPSYKRSYRNAHYETDQQRN
jgi:hypothetical protein